MKIKSYKGFTLIELLVVISIIGILAAVATVSYMSAQKQARDSTRKSDMGQYRNALEMYANKNNGLYVPITSRRDPSSFLCAPLGLTCPGPDDPKYDGVSLYFYSYITDAAGTQYVLWAKLENVAATTYWVVCSNGKNGNMVGSSPSDANCPI